MKTRFSTLDLMAVMHEFQPFIGMRVQNVYDIDSKTYLIRLQKPDHKATILFESGLRIHTTQFDWPKSQSPSGFSMKLRKHIKQKRLESCQQLGIDRIVDLQFGTEERACHVIIELYDRGNIILTDNDYVILNLLRRRTDKDTDVKFAVREKYKPELARQSGPQLDRPKLEELLQKAKPGDNLRRVLVPATIYGPALLEHCSSLYGFPQNAQIGKEIDPVRDIEKIESILSKAEEMLQEVKNGAQSGILTIKVETRNNPISGEKESISTYQEFHPMLFAQHAQMELKKFETFGQAVDEFFSKKESQKLDMKALHQEKEAMKKLENIKKDHQQRLKVLEESQDTDRYRADLIQLNQDLVDRAILVLRSAVANKLDWESIQELIDEAVVKGDPVASRIKGLKLAINNFTMLLDEPFTQLDEEEEDYEENEKSNQNSVLVDIDLNLNAYQNATKYFDYKKQAQIKQQKTLDASKKALKSAEAKTQDALKQVQVRTTVNKQRKVYWFEKFLWFISSENYLVLGGRDAQQNEILVKRYLNQGDVYVHADLRGASSVIVKNEVGKLAQHIPPRTLTEAATLAVCNSAAWDAKVVAGAWWVKHDQVTRTAPSGEYLTAGSFMIRGKKNFLPPVQLQMGFGFIFRLDDDSIPRHKGERKRTVHASSPLPDTEDPEEEEEEIELSEDETDKPNTETQEPEFPDVEVKLDLTNAPQDDVTIVQLGPKRLESTNKHRGAEPEVEETTPAPSDHGQPKRRQRNKQKKLKEKYKDQDEEERDLRMGLLGSAGQQKPDKKTMRKLAKKGKNPVKQQQKPKQTVSLKPEELNEELTVIETNNVSDQPKMEIEEKSDQQKPEEVEAEPEEDDEAFQEMQSELVGALDALTAKPTEEDILLFALPMCAPYITMTDYKFKVKLTPGPGKRGKATKTAIQIFLKDKSSTQRERDLLKATQESDLGRNLPGKVKVSAPQLMAVKQQQKKK